ncbi:MAG: hypothetical protein JOZ83_01430, partial [Silvibacterium sp.]|nr:hypothetical protein [Silvibacterium sp.]
MHKRNLWSSTILFSASIFFVCTAQAQTTPGKPVGDEVQEVVVQGSFTNTGTTSAMKMDIPLLDTPFSVQSYTQEFMN